MRPDAHAPIAFGKSWAQDRRRHGHAVHRRFDGCRRPDESTHMKNAFQVFAMVCLLGNAGCTTLRPTEASPEELQRLILAGDLLEPEQRVRLVAADEVVHRFRITAIDLEQQQIAGDDEVVPIAEIVAVDTETVSVGRTALLSGGIVGIGYLIAIAIAPAAILSAGAL